ncbi:type IV secretion system DNA-binding domain-containing protein [Mucilaginibacter sp.]|uniref:type IV secretion system DNA-binding domain-containing protein n=1 Tax=Mucilaginibacter sp. TaxID=1882438 RepID=UPI0025D7016B|nr:type IV secretion system DNA-binding domain-containing protein [Mucilaginibacter sp.]
MYCAHGENRVTVGEKESFFIDAPEMPTLARQKGEVPLFGVTIRAVAVADDIEAAQQCITQLALSITEASTTPYNALIALQGPEYPVHKRLADIVLRQSHRVGMLLNASELATFVHFPSMSVHSAKLIQSNRTTHPAPLSLIGHAYTLGINEHNGRPCTVGISTEQRLRHIHIMGATGTGKSTLLKSLILQDIHAGTGLMCLDPHGDLIEDILHAIPEERIKDVVLIDPSDTEFPIALNMLVAHSDIERELLASDLVALFRRFSTSWGDQMNSVFANAILAFVCNSKQYHLGDLRKFLIELPYRATVLTTITDPDISYYWQKEFPILKSSSIGPILTRLDAFLRPKVIRQMVCQKQSLNFAQLMDSRKIVLVKLSQGLLGAENSYLLGAFIVSKLQQTAMARQSQAAEVRIPFFCYIDEFQYFITPSMNSILSGARKYALGLILSHQDMQQVTKYDGEVANSVLSNAGTRICFRLGDTDAKKLEGGFTHFTAADLQNLSTGEAIARVSIMDADFNLAVTPYHDIFEPSHKNAIQAYSRRTYSAPIIAAETVQPPTIAPIPVVRQEQQQAPMQAKPVPVIEDTQKQESIREHRYLQSFIKKLAEAQGYKASLEVPTPDGTGQVDVVLERDGQRIAVEISVTTTAEWELHNIQKCLAAGYEQIVVCSSNNSKLDHIKQLVKNTLSLSPQATIRFVSPDMFQGVLALEPPRTPTHMVMKGYRVKVQYETGTNKQDVLRSIISAGKR